MTVAVVDVDGVLANFLEAALKGMNLRPASVTCWNFIEELLTPAERTEVIARCNNPYFWSHEIQPRPDAVGFGDRLQRKGFTRIVIATSPWGKEDKIQDDVMCARISWLRKHFGGQYDDVCFVKNKGRVDGDTIFEDGLHQIRSFLQAGYSRKAVVFDAPYNRVTGVNQFAQRVSSWSEL